MMIARLINDVSNSNNKNHKKKKKNPTYDNNKFASKNQ